MLPLIYLHSEDQATRGPECFRTQFEAGGRASFEALSVVTMIPCALLFMAAQTIEGLDPER